MGRRRLLTIFTDTGQPALIFVRPRTSYQSGSSGMRRSNSHPSYGRRSSRNSPQVTSRPSTTTPSESMRPRMRSNGISTVEPSWMRKRWPSPWRTLPRGRANAIVPLASAKALNTYPPCSLVVTPRASADSRGLEGAEHQARSGGERPAQSTNHSLLGKSWSGGVSIGVRCVPPGVVVVLSGCRRSEECACGLRALSQMDHGASGVESQGRRVMLSSRIACPLTLRADP